MKSYHFTWHCQYFYLLFSGFATFADKNKIFIRGLFSVNIDTNTMKPTIAGITKYPNHSSFRPKTVFVSNSTDFHLRTLALTFPTLRHFCVGWETLHSRARQIWRWPNLKSNGLTGLVEHYAFFNCLLFWQFLQLRELSCVVLVVVRQVDWLTEFTQLLLCKISVTKCTFLF